MGTLEKILIHIDPEEIRINRAHRAAFVHTTVHLEQADLVFFRTVECLEEKHPGPEQVTGLADNEPCLPGIEAEQRADRKNADHIHKGLGEHRVKSGPALVEKNSDGLVRRALSIEVNPHG